MGYFAAIKAESAKNVVNFMWLIMPSWFLQLIVKD